ncbi:S-adenosyl-L-methionine-dependent methyltransferase [Neurospora tetraspora]|uniref:S-adenosyl-L-methionine-dependent methyltransferase n=1 Tax=Neurospora tetraspora TaxID=94610 RepID=A0AAE0J9U6_9PEZI|nr:S-adenosyl-L-methionine-dependent methyltransferase [Neurospora tetraspora]
MSSTAKREAQSPAPKSPTPAPATRAATRELTPAPSTPAATREPTPGSTSPAAGTTAPLPGSHWAEQGLPEEAENDADSTLGSDVESSTASISSSILRYRTVNGRTYHSDSVTDGEYWGPNDAKQNEMLDIFHHTMTICLDGRLYDAPLAKDPENAIDIGTGTGLWAIDFADKFPNCHVVGTDISPIQPSWVPPNLSFEIDDYNKEWAYKSDFFDFIHLRWLIGTIKDCYALYKEAYRCCKPGGYIEHMDANATVESDDGSVDNNTHALGQWGPMWQAAGRKIGFECDILSTNIMQNAMKEAGFVNIVVKDYKVPIGQWSTDKKLNEVGLYFHAVMNQDLEGVLAFMFGKVMGWTKEEIANYIKHLKKEINNKDIHGYFVYRNVYGQKPLDA